MADKVKIKTFPPSGTRDFYPEDMVFRNWLFNHWKQVSREFGCLEYDAPIVEHAELWTLKSGGTDILNEMYSFEQDGIHLTLRPEITPSLSRMMMNYLPTAVLPLKLFSIPQCYRFENVSKGRKREFYQWNVDIFGAENVKSEIEIFMLIVAFLKRVGLTSNDVVIRISNRMILQKVLTKIGVADDKLLTAYNIIDKIEKLSREEISQMLKENVGIDDSCIDAIYKMISVNTIDGLIEYLGENDETYLEMKKIFEYAEKVGISEWILLDLKIVRGLNYYSGVVFECFTKQLDITRAILGGGVYSNMMESYGYSEHVNCIGFGLGDVVIETVIKELNLFPFENIGIEYVIIPFNDTFFCDACNIATRLREKGKMVDIYIKENKIRSAYSYADRKRADKVLMIAPSEWVNKQIVVKDLRTTDPTKKQITVDLEQYLASL
ncbi:histidyl-tRNA synthetase [Klosneuvirus KNV1]|uniref:histidine--tRNA ligase n=1 Tax=Klosneuvirus KNV1 TaxID=1977640 RepID=A0A1V0SLE3_9VIRU|nr:histidyl-tRNA synthetase [Klosneuvirus KNV1]